MEFRTIVTPRVSEFSLTPEKPLLMLGSCFTDNIGAKFVDAMWNVELNPCGVLYNPASICAILNRAVDRKWLHEDEPVERDGLWHSWLFDSHFSSPDKEIVLNKTNEAFRLTRNTLLSAQAVIITLGTAWIYQLVDNDEVVSNCHKFPPHVFKRTRLTVDEITDLLMRTITHIRTLNPDIKFIFTVSPIRHFKDGAYENVLSKSTLLLAVDNVIRQTSGVEYFPAYEIMLDDLRDYRFYAEDMIHPSSVAINYIWERFRQWGLTPSVNSLVDEATRLTTRLRHRPITTNRQKQSEFKQQTETLLADFISRYPYLRPNLTPAQN